MVEVPELNALQRTLADPLFQQQVKRDPVAPVILREDGTLLVD
jgi:hypothetical protein